ncbi:MAG TPA: cytochrome c [Anseongella sp.]|nr:cytochrome c [Anseongella sp.]
MSLCYGLSLLGWLISCSPPTKENAEKPTPGKYTLDSVSADTSGQAPPDSVLILGKKVYDSYCLACHQSDGKGVPGMYPPLNDSSWLADRERLVDVVLNGLSGKIVVNGKTYNQMMPTHNFLKDEEIAAVLTYVRKTFGNNSQAILPEEVAGRRKN